MPSPTSPQRAAEIDVYSVLLVAATLALGALVAVTLLWNMELSQMGGSGGGPFDFVPSR